MIRPAVAGLVLLMGCAPAPPPPDVPAGGWLLPGTQWRLVELGSEPFPARATATLTADGRIVGEAPCNRFTAAYSGRWPDLRFAPAATTRRACPDLAAETAFFATLARVDAAALDADGLVLTGSGGARLRFVRT